MPPDCSSLVAKVAHLFSLIFSTLFCEAFQVKEMDSLQLPGRSMSMVTLSTTCDHFSKLEGKLLGVKCFYLISFNPQSNSL